MRLKACIEAKIPIVPVYVASWDEVKQKQFIIKDNIGYGEWDWDMLANEWDASELNEWGLDVWQPEETEETNEATNEPKPCKHCEKMIP